jgi:hypothetical protein
LAKTSIHRLTFNVRKALTVPPTQPSICFANLDIIKTKKSKQLVRSAPQGPTARPAAWKHSLFAALTFQTSTAPKVPLILQSVRSEPLSKTSKRALPVQLESTVTLPPITHTTVRLMIVTSLMGSFVEVAPGRPNHSWLAFSSYRLVLKLS